MKRIYKYPLQLQPMNHLTLPKGSQVISVASQYGQPVLYVLVPMDVAENDLFRVHLMVTGENVYDAYHIERAQFLGTLLFHDDNFVAHFFLEKVN